MKDFKIFSKLLFLLSISVKFLKTLSVSSSDTSLKISLNFKFINFSDAAPIILEASFVVSFLLFIKFERIVFVNTLISAS